MAGEGQTGGEESRRVWERNDTKGGWPSTEKSRRVMGEGRAADVEGQKAEAVCLRLGMG